MNRVKKLSLFLVTLSLLTGCLVDTSIAPQPIPDRALVYARSEVRDSDWDPRIEQLGFVNSDGSDLVIVEAQTIVDKPVWSADGKMLFGLSKAEFGYPAYWEKESGNFGICDEDLPYFWQIEATNNPENPYEVLIYNVSEIWLIDLKECKELVRLVDFRAPPAHYNYQISGFSYNAVTQELVFGLVIDPLENQQYWIMHLDVESGEQRQLISGGLYPTWSPDGTQIAYIAWDGIYIAKADGSHVQRLVAQEMFDPTASTFSGYGIPLPRWSPDGEWLVYHICQKGCAMHLSEIYKVRVSGGVPVKLLSGGWYPTWRP